MLFEKDIVEVTNEVSDLSEDSLFGEDMFDFDVDMFDFSDSAEATVSVSPSIQCKGFVSSLVQCRFLYCINMCFEQLHEWS